MYYPLQKKHIDSSAFFELQNLPTVQHKIAEPWSERVDILCGGCPLNRQSRHKTHVCLGLSLCDQLALQTNPYNAKAIIFNYPSELTHILYYKNNPKDNTTRLVKIPVWQRGECSVLLMNDYWFVFTRGGLFSAAFYCETSYGSAEFLLVCFFRITVNTTHNSY